MASVDRNAPKRAASSDSGYSLMEFMREFPDDAACLDWLWRERYAPDGHTADCPKCEKPRRFHRLSGHPAYSCDTCGHHLHPLAGTIFHKSSTALHLWFYAMFLMSQTRCGVSAKQLERELGVTYKTAWRMLNRIRNQLMDEDDAEPLSGDVEVDETAFGGRPRVGQVRNRKDARMWAEQKTTVLGMVERGGRVRASVVEDRQGGTISGHVVHYVLPESVLFTDEWRAYYKTGKRFQAHHRIRHRDNIYVSGNVHTQTIEGFFSNLKRGIGGTYHAVSRKWLQGYLNEYAWRYNRRHDRRAMFETLLIRAAH